VAHRAKDLAGERTAVSRPAGKELTSGKVVHGRVELDGELPEGSSVTVIAADADAFEADPATDKMLLDAIAQRERGETVPLKQVLSNLRNSE